jgi:hypothetical protein
VLAGASGSGQAVRAEREGDNAEDVNEHHFERSKEERLTGDYEQEYAPMFRCI